MDEAKKYIEKKTGEVWEAKLFPDFVLTRPVDPTKYVKMRNISPATFKREYTEYWHSDGNVIRFPIEKRTP